ncbi:hypothetical protein [Pseudomonas frederiksbergensis]|uniref:hypothetical protein n=1 Tax=Pseudomonas frederiksbergensis TaxID=104087 RepID=UPI003D1FE9FF
MTMETVLMNMMTQRIRQTVKANSCVGTIGSEIFDAGLIELSERSFPPPHGEAYVLFARQRAPQPPYTTKELTLSFSKGFTEDPYDLTPSTPTVRLTFADNSDPTKTLVYTQREGQALLKHDDSTGVFTADLTEVIVENRDDDILKELTLEVHFSAKGSIVMSRRSRARVLAA